MQHNILNGSWQRIVSEVDHKKILSGHRIQRGDYKGPGRYMYFYWQQRCPRDCCYDDCAELIPASEVINLVKEQITSLAEVLKEARKKVN